MGKQEGINRRNEKDSKTVLLMLLVIIQRILNPVDSKYINNMQGHQGTGKLQPIILTGV